MEMLIFFLNNIAWFIFFYLFSKEKIPVDELPKINLKPKIFKKEENKEKLVELTDIPLKEILKNKK